MGTENSTIINNTEKNDLDVNKLVTNITVGAITICTTGIIGIIAVVWFMSS